MGSLIERIRARINDGNPCDHPGEWLPVQPPIAPEAIHAAESALGFSLPELLRRLYTEVGNGGFGPVFGLVPFSSDSFRQHSGKDPEFDLLGDYRRLRRRYSEDPIGWPLGLVPAFYCGCTVFEFVDCQQSNGRVIWFDEGTEELPTVLRSDNLVAPSLERRLEMWLAGEQT